jgi:hypothetical protein
VDRWIIQPKVAPEAPEPGYLWLTGHRPWLVYGEPVYRPLIALVILAAIYLGLLLGRVPEFRVDRTRVAIIGATAMVVSGAIA